MMGVQEPKSNKTENKPEHLTSFSINILYPLKEDWAANLKNQPTAHF
jgi:hypothetical protein